jgi:transposase
MEAIEIVIGGTTGHVEASLRFCPEARRLRRLAPRFRAMRRWRLATRLTVWMHTAASSGFSVLVQFARTLQRDLAAVEEVVTTRWSNGAVEEHINRLKMMKRQMYGRAGFELLKARVLP